MDQNVYEGIDLRYLDAFRVCDMINQPIHITTPDDIPVLAATFRQGFNKKYGKNKTFTHQAIAALQKYSWPGNVRELENLIERLAIVGDEPSITADQVSYLMEFSLSTPEKRAQQHEEAVEALGTSQSTIVHKMQQLGILKEEE